MVILLALAVAQPERARLVRTLHAYPNYGAMIAGCRRILADGHRVRDVRMQGFLPLGTDVLWVFSILGGALYGDTSRVAFIDRAGAVRYEGGP